MDDWVNSLLSAGTSQITVTAWGNSDQEGKPAPAAVQAVAPEIDEKTVEQSVPAVPSVAPAANDPGIAIEPATILGADPGDSAIAIEPVATPGMVTGDRAIVSEGVSKSSNSTGDSGFAMPEVDTATNDAGFSRPEVVDTTNDVDFVMPERLMRDGNSGGEFYGAASAPQVSPGQQPPQLDDPPEGGIRNMASARATLGAPPPPEVSEPGPAFGPGVDSPFMAWRTPGPTFNPGANFGGGLGGSPAGNSTASGGIMSAQDSGTDAMFTSLLNFADASTQAHVAASMKLDELARIIRNSM